MKNSASGLQCGAMIAGVCFVFFVFVPGAVVRCHGKSMNDGYVGSSNSDDFCAFDVETYSPGGCVDFPGTQNYPYDSVMNPDGTEVWFTDASEDAVFVIDRATNSIASTISPGGYVVGVAISADGNTALASARDDDWVAVIDPATHTITGYLTDITGQPIYSVGLITYSLDANRFYLVQWYGSKLFEIAGDGSGVLRQVDFQTGSLWKPVASHEGQTLYITDRGNDAVQVVDCVTMSIIDTIPVGDDPWGIDITQDDSTLVVTCEDSNEVYIIDLATRETRVVQLAGNQEPRSVDILNSSGKAFVTTGDADEVLVIDIATGNIEQTITFPGVGNTNTVCVEPTVWPVCLHTGDVDASGGLTPADALAAFEIYLLINPDPTETERCAADCNGDGAVTPSDAQCIFWNYLNGSCECADGISGR